MVRQVSKSGAYVLVGGSTCLLPRAGGTLGPETVNRSVDEGLEACLKPLKKPWRTESVEAKGSGRCSDEGGWRVRNGVALLREETAASVAGGAPGRLC